MARINREQLQKRVVQHYVNVANKSPSIILYKKRFLVKPYFRKYEESGYVGDKPRFGRPKKLSRGQLTRLKHLVNKRTEIPLHRLVPRFRVSYQTISNYLKAMGIRYHKKNNEHQNIPINNLKRCQLVPDDYIACCRTMILN